MTRRQLKNTLGEEFRNEVMLFEPVRPAPSQGHSWRQEEPEEIEGSKGTCHFQLKAA